MAIRYYMDVHIPNAVTIGLRQRGVDVLTSQDDGTREWADEPLLERAVDLQRVLVTQDDELLSIASKWQEGGHEFSGIIYAHQMGPSIGQLVQELELLSVYAEPIELANTVTYLPLL